MFIVIESVVGGGKRQQYKVIAKKLREQEETVIHQDFPDRAGVLFENVLYPTIHEGVSNSPKQRFMIYLLDQLAHVERIKKYQKDGYFIAESYFTSTLAYQVLYEKALSIKDALMIAEIMKLPKPDLAIYIDTPYENALKRRTVDEGYGDKDDFWGSSEEQLEKVDICFQQLIEDQVFCPWEVIDGSKSDLDVTGDILDIIAKKRRAK